MILIPKRKGTMRHFLKKKLKKLSFTFILILTIPFNSFEKEIPELQITALSHIPLPQSLKDRALRGDVQVLSQVDSVIINQNKKQSLNFSIIGLHPKDCDKALRKLSRYEDYDRFLDFVKEADYKESDSQVRFLLNHILLPFPMSLEFKLPRIERPGEFPFSFDRGFLMGLQGKIVVIEETMKNSRQKRCLFYTSAAWSGPHTGIPDSVFAFFSKVLSQTSMELLFRHTTLVGF